MKVFATIGARRKGCMERKLAPVSPQLVLCYIAERVLGLPKSY